MKVQDDQNIKFKGKLEVKGDHLRPDKIINEAIKIYKFWEEGGREVCTKKTMNFLLKNKEKCHNDSIHKSRVGEVGRRSFIMKLFLEVIKDEMQHHLRCEYGCKK
jgi:hypothetical protein